MWLPRAPEPVDRSALAPWPVPGVTYEAELAYIVVDELHGGIAGLVVSPWPRVDERGRLVFGAEQESTRVAAPAGALEALLSEQRTPVVEVGSADLAALQTRAVQIGDVFAACVHGTPVSGDPAAGPRPWAAPGRGGPPRRCSTSPRRRASSRRPRPAPRSRER